MRPLPDLSLVPQAISCAVFLESNVGVPDCRPSAVERRPFIGCCVLTFFGALVATYRYREAYAAEVLRVALKQSNSVAYYSSNTRPLVCLHYTQTIRRLPGLESAHMVNFSYTQSLDARTSPVAPREVRSWSQTPWTLPIPTLELAGAPVAPTFSYDGNWFSVVSLVCLVQCQSNKYCIIITLPSSSADFRRTMHAFPSGPSHPVSCTWAMLYASTSTFSNLTAVEAGRKSDQPYTWQKKIRGPRVAMTMPGKNWQLYRCYVEASCLQTHPIAATVPGVEDFLPRYSVRNLGLSHRSRITTHRPQPQITHVDRRAKATVRRWREEHATMTPISASLNVLYSSSVAPYNKRESKPSFVFSPPGRTTSLTS